MPALEFQLVRLPLTGPLVVAMAMTRPNRGLTVLLIFTAAVSGIGIWGIYYSYRYTPLPVYLLDKVNLRPFFLPNIICNRCNNFTVRYLVDKEARCEPDEEIFLLNVLISYSPNVIPRKINRASWGGVKSYRGLKVKTIFAFGIHDDKNFNKQLDFEQKKYRDIVQGDFKDDYVHLTEKTMMALKWISTYCPKVKYVLKTDDDSFNHPHRIIDYLLEVKIKNFVGGYCFTVTPDRRVSSKYYVPYKSYPDSYYPTYCAGPGYILSRGAIDAIIKVAPNVSYLPMEDVYVAGMCREVAGIPYTNIEGMVISQDQMSKCDLATWAKNAHNVVPEIQQQLWTRALQANAYYDCTGQKIKKVVYLVLGLVIWARLLTFMMRHRSTS